ncbi:MAG: acetylornithine aminotransferase [Elusimicrobia bacterium RIFCSPLOWO2_01_FULL_59_12]|nr:MAG: acetylornithine aminotransferase [Elusimicrobia bacterium RIFCSPLOWO2_01_FULL_59_12]
MDIKKLTDQHIFNTYKRYPLAIQRAKGSWVWDDHGKKYLDFFSGLAVSGVGHAMPSVVAAIRAQAGKLLHASNLYYTEPAARLAEQLCKRSFADKVFFSNSGSEANECAIKLARRHGWKQGGRHEIIVFENSFHGRTLGALAATAQPKFHEGFGPLPEGFVVAKLNDLRSVERLINAKTTAILIEPIQGEGGIYAARKEFLGGLKNFARQSDLLLMFDEVQCGLGRMGHLFAYHYYGIEPDVLTLAKGLGGGMPIAATLATAKHADLLGPGDHGTTFGGNPVCAAAALAVLKLLTPRLIKNVQAQGDLLLEALRNLVANHESVKEVRGVGFMIGIELTVPGAPFVQAAREQGLLINCTQGNVLRFLPPLAMSNSELQFALRVLKCILQ